MSLSTSSKITSCGTQDPGGDGDGPSVHGGGTFLEKFRELQEVEELLNKIPQIHKEFLPTERFVYRLIEIIDKYQEQPHLLDPHLESLVTRSMDMIRTPGVEDGVVHLNCKFLHLLSKARGFKNVIRLLPHEVADLEPVLALLARQNINDSGTWQTRYILILWLSIVGMIPFDMERLDSNAVDDEGNKRKPVMERILEIRAYLKTPDLTRDAAAYTMSRFLTRPDVKKLCLPSVLDDTLRTIQTTSASTHAGIVCLAGNLRMLSLLFKHGKREDLVEYVPRFLQAVVATVNTSDKNPMLRKLAAKVIQRLGLTLLKAKVAQWRYTRGNRSLAANLGHSSAVEAALASQSLTVNDEEEDYDIPDEIEEVIEFLLTSLRDTDTIVRWSAAKGVGRLTGRLPKELADDIVSSLLSLFTITETNTAWHGGCLALAELGRRGLLLPQHLYQVVPIVVKALNYDEKRGCYSVGSHVRDAACYVCWAFARAYEPADIQPFIQQIASALIIVSIFDREVTVRRAAAAAFQENVGRQGQFPHGIEILTTCDYFAVGNRTHSYLELSVFVAQFEEYAECLIDHLSQVKSSHWDIAVRELTAQALHNLAFKDHSYCSKTVLPQLVKHCLDIDLNQRHGAILASGDITYALYLLALRESRPVSDYVSSDVFDGLEALVTKLSAGRFFRGIGGEMMLKAVCYLIHKLSLMKIHFHDGPVIQIWQELINQCLEHKEAEVQKAAVSTIPAFFTEFYQEPDGTAKCSVQDDIIMTYLHKVKDPVESTRIGFLLATGSLPQFFISGKLTPVLTSLCQACVCKDQSTTSTRKSAVHSLTSVCDTVGFSQDGQRDQVLCQSNIDEVWNTLFAALTDYTVDHKGDSGALVREAAMTGLEELTKLVLSVDPQFMKRNIVQMIFTNLVQQAAEKIDRTRTHAGRTLLRLLYMKPEIPYVPHREILQQLFPRVESEQINWYMPGETFPRLSKLLGQEPYTYQLTLGMIVSVGGITESLVKYSSHALLEHLREIMKDLEKLNRFTDKLLGVFRDHQKVDRVTIPLMKTLSHLLSNGCFKLYASVEDHFFPATTFELVLKEIRLIKNHKKISVGADVLCDLLAFKGNIRLNILRELMLLLGHAAPPMRRSISGKIYETLLIEEDLVKEESMEEVLTLLSETVWDGSTDKAREARNQVWSLVGMNMPLFKPKK